MVVDFFWDAWNVGTGIISLSGNLITGNWAGALVDAAGVAADAGAAVVPGIPGGASSAIQATRAASTVVETVAKSTTKAPDLPSKSAKEMAADLSRQIGKQSVEIKTQSGAVRYDLTGATHKGTPTPHVQTKTYNTNPKTGETFLNKVSGPAREATKQDIRTARKFLETKIFDVE